MAVKYNCVGLAEKEHNDKREYREEEGGGEEHNADTLADLSPPEEDDPHNDHVPDTFVSKNGKVQWSSVPYETQRQPPPQRRNTETPSGPTEAGGAASS